VKQVGSSTTTSTQVETSPPVFEEHYIKQLLDTVRTMVNDGESPATTSAAAATINAFLASNGEPGWVDVEDHRKKAIPVSRKQKKRKADIASTSNGNSNSGNTTTINPSDSSSNSKSNNNSNNANPFNSMKVATTTSGTMNSSSTTTTLESSNFNFNLTSSTSSSTTLPFTSPSRSIRNQSSGSPRTLNTTADLVSLEKALEDSRRTERDLGERLERVVDRNREWAAKLSHSFENEGGNNDDEDHDGGATSSVGRQSNRNHNKQGGNGSNQKSHNGKGGISGGSKADLMKAYYEAIEILKGVDLNTKDGGGNILNEFRDGEVGDEEFQDALE